MQAVALSMAQLGYPVHPVHGIVDGVCTCSQGMRCRSAGKHPVLPGWVTMATTDPETINSWIWQDFNVGVVPRGFCILDFDGAEGKRTLEAMSQYLPELPGTTPIVVTGSGGYHVYIQGEAKTRTRLLPGLDIRGIGGQAVLPPSKHFSGNHYRWLQAPCTPPSAPEWLHVARGDIPDELRPAQLITKEDLKQIARGKLKKPAKAIVDGTPFAMSGERNATLASIAGALSQRFPYADPNQIAELFRPSLKAMDEQSPGAPTEVILVSMLQRFQANQREELKKRPHIQVTTDIEDMALEAIEALVKSDLEIYSRAGLLVRVKPPEDLPSGVLRGETAHSFEEITPPNLLAHLTTSASWLKQTKAGDSPTVPPPSVVMRVSQRGAWPGVPHAERIIEGPMLRPDGTYFAGGGYDSATGVLSMGDPDNEPLPSVSEALDVLLGVVVDFPFATPAHGSCWLASLLTAVAQPIFRGPSPLFLIDANTRAVGKSLMAEITILIASGRSPMMSTVGQDNVEDGKLITTYAREGAQCIMIDNVEGLFGTANLCAALTLHDSCWSGRILAKTKSWSGVLKPTWFCTANNIRLRPDIARRTCYIRLDCPLERPELRSGFKRPSLMSWVQDHRSSLYRAALALLHHYMQAGRPQQDIEQWGGYESWSALIRQTIVWVGLPDPADTRDELEASDEEQELIRLLFVGLSELDQDVITPTYIHALLYGSAQTVDSLTKHETLREALETGCVQKSRTPTTQSIGRLMTRLRGRVSGNLRLEKLYKKGSKWRIHVNG